jgi:tellurite methyltransferase
MEHIFNKKSVAFFESQFQRQVRDQEYALNSFEILALEYLTGEILDLGCGLGNFSLEAGRRGHRVLAVDASATAVARLNKGAEREGLPVRGIQADIESWTIEESYDTIVVIGLLMLFRRETALKLLTAIQDHVKPGGRAIVNVLIEGTTYLGMFDPDNYCLFRRTELEERFDGWSMLESRTQMFPAPEGTRKDVSTIVAEKPSHKS